MIKLLIADDEPLVCVGLSSMIPWEDYNIEIVGTARNGRQAAEMIEKFRPDIVISDIKMPLKSGLELAEECFEKYGEIPLFIILTSFEEFEYVRRAIKFQAVDYLVKLELNAEILARTVNKALGILERIRGSGAAESVRRNAVNSLGEKFFLRLCNGLFESRDQYLAQKEELGIDFSAPAYSVLSCEIEPPDDSGKEADPSLYANAVQMIREITEKRIPVHVMTLGLRQFTMTLWLSETDRDAQKQSITNTLEAVMTGVRNYFSLNFRAAAGFPVDDPFCLSESYHSSRRIFRDCRPDRPLIVFESSVTGESGDFNFSEIRPVIRRAFEELDSAALHEAITAICDFFEGRTDLCLHALDAAGCILSMALTLLPEGEELVSEIFSDDAEGYRG
ncbi:response regulator, partial [Treponema sp. OttesenSCG-928-L16]|nr:response regulator [Treponema sp. OttesenSCG-928-L16]